MGSCGERNLRGPCRKAKPSGLDRKSTRLNPSHLVISYAVFCLKKKNNPIVFSLFSYFFHISLLAIPSNPITLRCTFTYVARFFLLRLSLPALRVHLSPLCTYSA